jgi:hypothetical protein
MSSSIVARNGRQSPPRKARMPLAIAGAALFGLSLLLSVGPALGAANNGHGTTGDVKVHDAATGVETSGSGNEPHVCDFWLGFTSDTSEVGSWTVVSWAPTGDGSTVISGIYSTSGDGVDASTVIDLPAGHYRVEWAAAGVSVTSTKTFWVDAECEQSVTPLDESPAEDTASPPDESPAEESVSPAEESVVADDESPAEESVSPAEESVVADDESLAEESVSPVEESVAPPDESPAEESVSPAEESVVADDESPTEESVSPAEESVEADDESPVEDPASQAEEPASDDAGAPSDESPATPGDTSDEQDPAQVVDPGSGDPGTTPAQDERDATATSGEPTMSDTATPMLPVRSGLMATLAVLLLIVVYATTRRGTRSPRGEA